MSPPASGGRQEPAGAVVQADGMPAPGPLLRTPDRSLAVAGALLALLTLAHLPWLFTRGDILRGALLPLVAAWLLLRAAPAAGPVERGASRAERLAPLLPLLVLLPMLLAALASGRPDLAAPASLARGAAPWLALAALLAAFPRLVRGPGELLRLWRPLLLAGGLAAAWVYVEVLLGVEAGAGPFGRPGVAGPFLGALLGPALVLPWTARTWLRGLLVALLAAGTAFTHSRTGMAAGALSALVAAGLARGVLPGGLRRAALALAALGGLAAALLLTGVAPAPGDGETLRVRQGVWRAGAALVAERPLTGHGLGALRSEVLRRRNLDEARLSRGREPYMAHNDVLQAAVEGGLGSGLALAALLLGGLALALSDRSGAGGRATAAAAGVLAALAAAGLAEQVLPDPAQVPLAALALASVLVCRRSTGPGAAVGADGPRPRRPGAGLLWSGAALALLAVGAVTARDVPADLSLRAYREAIRGGVSPEEAVAAAQQHLVEGALRWRPAHPEALYRLGVSEAEFGRLEAARRLWRDALRAAPGFTDARLEVARAYEDEGRGEDADAALREALQHDPTRYDAALRLGHRAFGTEPVPDLEADTSFSPFECLKRYNAAAELAPARFETYVAYARVYRRIGNLQQALRSLEQAAALSPGAGGEQGLLPGEIRLEEFRVREAEQRMGDLELASILTFALLADPGLSTGLRKEAARIDAEGAAREERARVLRAAASPPDLAPPDMRSADRAYGALTRRLMALLQAGMLDADALVREARVEGAAGRFRGALARQRAVLVYGGDAPPESASERTAFFGRRGQLLLEAAQSASRFDGALARTYYAEGHLLTGLELLEQGRPADAERLLAKAREDAPTDPRACVALARLFMRQGQPERAEAEVLEALRRNAAVKAVLPAEPDLAPLLKRPAVREALQGS